MSRPIIACRYEEGGFVSCAAVAAGGFEKRFDIYDHAKADIDEMIRRINLPTSDADFMPYEQFRVLSAADKNLFQKWKDDGLLEKVVSASDEKKKAA